MSERTVKPLNRNQLVETIYKTLAEADELQRQMKGWREVRGGRGPTIKRGTKRPALAIALADAILAAVPWSDEEDEEIVRTEDLAIAPGSSKNPPS